MPVCYWGGLLVGLSTTCEAATGVALVSAPGKIASVNAGTNGSSMSPNVDACEADPLGIAPFACPTPWGQFSRVRDLRG